MREENNVSATVIIYIVFFLIKRVSGFIFCGLVCLNRIPIPSKMTDRMTIHFGLVLVTPRF